MKDISFPMAPNDQKVDATIPIDCQVLTDVKLFVPDNKHYYPLAFHCGKL